VWRCLQRQRLAAEVNGGDRRLCDRRLWQQAAAAVAASAALATAVEADGYGLVLILAESVCNIWDFFLVHSYVRVGLYLCSTVTYCRPALKNKKLKKSLRYGYNKNSYRPILWNFVIQNRTVSKFYVTPFFL
jgi:hypothetical protein